VTVESRVTTEVSAYHGASFWGDVVL